MDHMEKPIEAYDKEMKRDLCCKWALGWQDRGLGHGNYGIITAEGKLLIPDLPREIAEHIINLHNTSLQK